MTPTTDEERRTQIGDYLKGFAKARGIAVAEIREEWSERAAIREYLGGIRHRRNAELHAVSDTTDGFTERRGMPRR